MRRFEPGVLLCSGGIDSVTLLYWLRATNSLRGVVQVDYGQASAAHQAELLRKHTHRLGIPDRLVRVEKIPWPEHARGRGYIFNTGSYPAPLDDPYAPVYYDEEQNKRYVKEQFDHLQGRNVVFLTYAAAWAISLGCSVLHTAFQYDAPVWAVLDRGGIEDSDVGRPFVREYNHLAASGAFSEPLRVSTPLLDWRLTKSQIATIATWLGANLHDTHSCEFYPACGQCGQCLIRARTFAQLGILFTSRAAGIVLPVAAGLFAWQDPNRENPK